jgi:hypothetical protein
MKQSPRPRTTASLSESVHQRLNMYALAAAAAGVGILASAPAADAKIVYTPANEQLSGKPFPLDLNHDGKVEFFLWHYNIQTSTRGNDLLACHAPVFNGSRTVCISSVSSYAPNALNAIRVTDQGFGAALRRGAKIQHGDQFRNKRPVNMGGVKFDFSSHTFWSGPWLNGGKGVKNRYLGIKFLIGGRFHFGWARLTVTTQGKNFTATLTGYAYETIPRKAIVAGQRKSPDAITAYGASLGQLAAGASAIPAWRVRQTAATTH